MSGKPICPWEQIGVVRFNQGHDMHLVILNNGVVLQPGDTLHFGENGTLGKLLLTRGHTNGLRVSGTTILWDLPSEFAQPNTPIYRIGVVTTSTCTPSRVNRNHETHPS